MRLLFPFNRTHCSVSPNQSKTMLSGVEVAAEIYDLLNEDLRRFYPDIIQSAHVMLVELQDHILSTYDREISDYTSNLFSR